MREHGELVRVSMPMCAEGARISRRELKARWAFSEFRSGRFVPKYARLSPEKIRSGVAFSELSEDEISHLVWMLESYRAPLAPELDKAEQYECQAWTKEQFGRTYTIVVVSPNGRENIPFLSYIACPRLQDDLDARAEADKVPFDVPFQQTEPVIVLPYGKMPLLLEGYLRGVLFMRSRDPDARILVWFPTSAS